MDVKKMLEDFDTAYNKAFNEGDAAGCAASFADDLLLLPPDQPLVRGKQAFQDINQSRMEQSKGSKHTIELIEYGTEGDLIYQVGTFAISDGSQGKFLNIFKRQADGSWKVAISTFNSDKPSAA
ncbi:YybH family protein [Bauldia sp.]|uniref:YybH family protein n=1 Tax=Bauldia sp. TaxID=2575872 RepID=UPI003BAD6F29